MYIIPLAVQSTVINIAPLQKLHGGSNALQRRTRHSCAANFRDEKPDDVTALPLPEILNYIIYRSRQFMRVRIVLQARGATCSS